jgi:murein DD-endopeptidase MepM/ murein hydrolase activator NlpD
MGLAMCALLGLPELATAAGKPGGASRKKVVTTRSARPALHPPAVYGSNSRAALRRPQSGTRALAATQRTIIESTRRSLDQTLHEPTGRVILRESIDCSNVPDSLKSPITDKLCARRDVGAKFHRSDRLFLKQSFTVKGRSSISSPSRIGVVLNRGNRIYALVNAHDHLGREQIFDEFGRAQSASLYNVPLDFERISSRFSPRRYHPILKKWVAHRGVDFVAARGTPVWSTADGVVLEAGYKARAGNTVKIEHDGGYTSEYLHLGQILPNVKPGARLARGQILGTVGVTGMTTGAHLHFALLKNGKAIDPLKSPLMSILSTSRTALASNRPQTSDTQNSRARLKLASNLRSATSGSKS